MKNLANVLGFQIQVPFSCFKLTCPQCHFSFLLHEVTELGNGNCNVRGLTEVTFCPRCGTSLLLCEQDKPN